jgi:hypothetical protein
VLAAGAAAVPPASTGLLLRGTSVAVEAEYDGAAWTQPTGPHAVVISGDDDAVLLAGYGRLSVEGAVVRIDGDLTLARRLKEYSPGPDRSLGSGDRARRAPGCSASRLPRWALRRQTVIEGEREDGGGAARACQHVAMTKASWISGCRTKAVAVGAAALVVTGSMAACAAEDLAGESSAACAAPSVTVEPATVAPGDEVTVWGEAMMDGCADSISMHLDGNVISQETAVPMAGLDVVYLAADMQRVLMTVDADEHGAFEITVRIPQDSPLGHTEISVGPEWVEQAKVEVVG